MLQVRKYHVFTVYNTTMTIHLCDKSLPTDDYRVETRPLPEIRDEEVLVKVLAVGICAGDAKCYAGAPYFWGKLHGWI